MRNSILSIRAVGALFIAVGVYDVYKGMAPQLEPHHRMAGDDAIVLAIGVAALAGGVAVLRGRTWGRWLLAAWMALHAAISAARPTELAAHLVIFGLVAFLLFRPGASAHFARRASG